MTLIRGFLFLFLLCAVILGVNVAMFGIVIVKYLVMLFGEKKELKKNNKKMKVLEKKGVLNG